MSRRASALLAVAAGGAALATVAVVVANAGRHESPEAIALAYGRALYVERPSYRPGAGRFFRSQRASA